MNVPPKIHSIIKIPNFLLRIIIVTLFIFWHSLFHLAYAQDSSNLNNLPKNYNESKLQIALLQRELNSLKSDLHVVKKRELEKFIKSAQFIDLALSSANQLQSLVLKENYRNKIASLNNPTSNDLGFNLENEIHISLKPLLDKAKKTNSSKFNQVVSSFLQTGKNNSLSLFPASGVFTSILGVVGNLTVSEKGISKEDLDSFIKNIEKYFNQYERLYQSNMNFNKEMDKITEQLKLLQSDVKNLIQDLIVSLYLNTKKEQLKNLSSEDLILKFLVLEKVESELGKIKDSNAIVFPLDAIKSCKEIFNSIQRIYQNYTVVYNRNFDEIKIIIQDTKTVSASVNQTQLNKTFKNLESLFLESKTFDANNLRLKSLSERLDLLSF